MDYAEATAAFFEPSPAGAVSPPTVDSSPARRFRDAIEPIAMHSVWSKGTYDRQATLGLNFFTGYVWGRASALGEPDAGVVTATFAVFDPALIEPVYLESRQACSRDDIIAARTESTITSLDAALGGADVSEVADALQLAVSAADGVGRSLFSGFLGQPWPEHPVGRLWRACELAREHRGDSHVAVCAAKGLGPIEMNILTELWVGMPLGSYTATRGWPQEAIDAAAEGLRGKGMLDGDGLSAEGQTFRDSIETQTDALEQPILDAIGPGADGVIDQLAAWSELCVKAGAFPPSVFKRAAG